MHLSTLALSEEEEATGHMASENLVFYEYEHAFQTTGIVTNQSSSKMRAAFTSQHFTQRRTFLSSRKQLHCAYFASSNLPHFNKNAVVGVTHYCRFHMFTFSTVCLF